MLHSDGKLILFARAPDAGSVKTRLIPILGEQGAAELQKRMTRHIIDQIFNNYDNIELQCSPDSKHSFFISLLDNYCIELNPQQGHDLGQKMSRTLERALTQYKYAVIIGTDAPVLSNHYIEQAFQALKSGIDVVLGPAEDGGYVLIGLSHFDADIFIDIDWCTSRVLEQTREQIRKANMSYHELTTLWDVDRPADLARIQNNNSLSYLLHNLELKP